MKQQVLSLIRSCGSVLPLQARHALVKALLGDSQIIDKYGFFYLRDLCRDLNIVAISASGDYGVMTSSPGDVALLKNYAKTGRWAYDVFERLKEFFPEQGGTYLDIGANIGMTTIPIAKYNPRVRCFAFEPEPSTYHNLTRNLFDNCPSATVTPLNIALHEKKGDLPFEISHGDNLGDHRLHIETNFPQRQFEAGRIVINVPCERLDDLDIDRSVLPIFAKIDTQGAEPLVIAGGRQTLARASSILIEWSPYHMARVGTDPEVVLGFLLDNFTRGEIITTDLQESDVKTRGSLKEIADELRSTVKRWQNDPFNYVDILVLK